jgi:hypothetical protein
VNVYTCAPASETAIAAGDYDSFDSVPQCDTPITYTGWGEAGYNDFALNSNGIASISKTGITKFGIRNANYDVTGTAPTWGSAVQCYLIGYFADQTGTDNDPKLVVTYHIPGSFINLTRILSSE